MADLLINQNRHSYNIHKNQSSEKKTSSKAPAGAPAPSIPLKDRMDQYQSLVDRLEEDNRSQLLNIQWKDEEKRPPAEEIEAKILQMRSKLRAGGRLTSEEKAYLARYAPGELQKVLRVEQERSALRARLEGCESKESANQAYQGACSSAMNADPEDPDLSSVLVGQFAAALREVSNKPTKAQLEKQDVRAQMRLNARA